MGPSEREHDAPNERRAAPTNVVVVLLDSLNRHMLNCYGNTEFETPNLSRLAARSLRFDNHMVGSLPCMPARHDILVGFQDFLWRPWGSIEVWEQAITHDLRQKGVTTMLVSDHPHLFETGGENYHTEFTGWEYLRGHEGDPWKTVRDLSAVGAPSYLSAPPLPEVQPVQGRMTMPYEISRTWFREEGDFPGPRTMAAAADWLRRNYGAHDRFFLFVDEFDPHEPFDTPARWAEMYDPDWIGPRRIWPPYVCEAFSRGLVTEREAIHLRANYGGKMSMIDHWLGELLRALDEKDAWKDTAVIVSSDHGHFLGEHEVFGKPSTPIFRELGHIPLLVAWPGVEPGQVDALTTSVDLHATVADVFDAEVKHRTHGRSLRPVIEGAASSVRAHVAYGYWGREVHATDGTWRYVRRPVDGNYPLAVWSNRWSTAPAYFPGARDFPPPDHRATLEWAPGGDVRVIRQVFRPGDLLPRWADDQPQNGAHLLFNVREDPLEVENRAGGAEEANAADLLRAALEDIDVPPEQLERIGLS